MNTSKVLSGSTNLVFDMVDGVTNIVEGMFRNIAAMPFPLDREPEGSAPGIAGAVYAGIRGVTGATRQGTNAALPRLLENFQSLEQRRSGPHAQAIIAALNGVCGDHLARTQNALAIPMTLNALLPIAQPPGESGIATKPPAFSHLFDSQRESAELFPMANAFGDERFSPSGRVLILLHGLCMNDIEWTAHGQNHGFALADAHGFTPVFARYNSGLHISDNGKALVEQINGLVASWPVPLESISFVGFSMGGLITRSALRVAEETALPWLGKVDKVAYVGTPHHGSALERGGYWLQKSLTVSPYIAPLAALGRIRSAGITDLRYGNILEKDWCGHDEHEDNADHRHPVPLAEGIEHFAIAGSLSQDLGEKLRSDGLVHPRSALGKHKDPAFTLRFESDHTATFSGIGHLAMLGDARISKQLVEWFG